MTDKAHSSYFWNHLSEEVRKDLTEKPYAMENHESGVELLGSCNVELCTLSLCIQISAIRGLVKYQMHLFKFPLYAHGLQLLPMHY